MSVTFTLFSCALVTLLALGLFHLCQGHRNLLAIFGLVFMPIMIAPLFGPEFASIFAVDYQISINAYLIGTLVGYPLVFGLYLLNKKKSKYKDLVNKKRVLKRESKWLRN